MELFTNTYQSHDVVGVIIFSSIMGAIGLTLVVGAVYIYYSSPVLPVDPVLGNLRTGQATELQFVHPDVESAITINCVLEESLNVEALFIPIICILVLVVFHYY